MRGVELVALSERFNQAVFLGAIGFVGLSALAAGAFLPLRDSAVDGRPPLSLVAAVVLVLALVGLAVLRPGEAYRGLRRHPRFELALVFIAASLLTVLSPLRNELWWPACAILMLLGTAAPMRRALAYCFVVLVANLAAHIVSGTINDVSTVDVVGLWVGLPFWTALAAAVPERMAAFILTLNSVQLAREEGDSALRVEAASPHGRSAAPPTSRDPLPGSDDADLNIERGQGPAAITRSGVTQRLTARQLQVVALVADGLRYEDVAVCLSISAHQVHRHVTNAMRRAEARSVNQLVALVVADGMLAGAERCGPGLR